MLHPTLQLLLFRPTTQTTCSVTPQQLLHLGWSDGGWGRGGLTQLRDLAENKGVGPELGDGGGVELVVAHRPSEAAGCDDVHHVEARPQSSNDAAERTQERLSKYTADPTSSEPKTACSAAVYFAILFYHPQNKRTCRTCLMLQLVKGGHFISYGVDYSRICLNLNVKI